MTDFPTIDLMTVADGMWIDSSACAEVEATLSASYVFRDPRQADDLGIRLMLP